jgi:hypothetical protein
MSVELKDFRGKLTPLGYCWLEAEHRTTGRDQSEIVRDLVHQWASVKSMAAIEAQKLMEAEGIAGNGGERKGAAK